MKRLLPIIFCFFAFPALAQIYEADDFDQMKKIILKEIDSESLVLFDVDDVLIRSNQESDFRSPIRIRLKKALRLHHSTQKVDEIFSPFFKQRNIKLAKNAVNPRPIRAGI